MATNIPIDSGSRTNLNLTAYKVLAIVASVLLLTTALLAVQSSPAQATVTNNWATPDSNPGSIVYSPAAGKLYTSNGLQASGRDSSRRTISQIELSGATTQVWKNLEVPATRRLAVDPNNGTLYTLGSATNAVIRITSAGVVDKTWASIEAPTAIAVDKAGNVFVVNSTQSKFSSVTKITPDGQSTDLGQVGDGASNIAVANDGTVYTTNGAVFGGGITPTISAIFPGSNPIKNWISTSKLGGYPAKLAVSPSGNLYVAKTTGNAVAKITPDGVVDPDWGKPRWDEDHFNANDTAIAATTDDTVYVVSPSKTSNTGRISKITPEGVTIPEWATTNMKSNSIALDPTGNIYAASLDASAITKVTVNHVPDNPPTPTPTASPTPSPTPTAPPTPTTSPSAGPTQPAITPAPVVKRAQHLRKGTFPKAIKKSGTTVVNLRNARTVEGRPVRATVRIYRLKGKKCYRVAKGKNGQLSLVKAKKKCSFTAKITYRAIGTSTLLPLTYIRTYKVKK